MKTYTHDNGRRCILGPDGKWRHWDNDGVIVAPRDEIDWVCRMDHWVANTQDGSVLTDSEIKDIKFDALRYSMMQPTDDDPAMDEDMAKGYQPESEDKESNERGEFGMPIVGSTFMRDAGPIKGMFLNVKPGRIFRLKPNMVCTITEAGVSIDYGSGVGVPIVEANTDDARYILSIVPDILVKFLEKNTQYKDAQAMDLGAKGIVPDLNRKVAAIKGRVWDAVEGGDSVEELLGDVIGHALLMLAQLRTE